MSPIKETEGKFWAVGKILMISGEGPKELTQQQILFRVPNFTDWPCCKAPPTYVRSRQVGGLVAPHEVT